MRLTTILLIAPVVAFFSNCANNGSESPAEDVATATNSADTILPVAAEDGGYRFTGPHQLTATVSPGEAGGWLLSGGFEFPTGGYSVEGPRISVLKRLPEHVIIGLEVEGPAPGTIVTQVITPVTFEETITVSDRATFEIHLVQTIAETP